LLWTGIVNFFILKKLWSFNGIKSKTNESTRKLEVDLDEDVELATQSKDEGDRRKR
jgi:hypothetical protein